MLLFSYIYQLLRQGYENAEHFMIPMKRRNFGSLFETWKISLFFSLEGCHIFVGGTFWDVRCALMNLELFIMDILIYIYLLETFM